MDNDQKPTTFIRQHVTPPADAPKCPVVCCSCGHIMEASAGGYVNIRGYHYCANGVCDIAALSNNPCRGCGR